MEAKRQVLKHSWAKLKKKKNIAGQQWRNKKGRPRARRLWTSLSKTISKGLKLLPGLYKEKIGQRWVGTCRQAVKVIWIAVMESITRRVFEAQGSPYWFRG